MPKGSDRTVTMGKKASRPSKECNIYVGTVPNELGRKEYNTNEASEHIPKERDVKLPCIKFGLANESSGNAYATRVEASMDDNSNVNYVNKGGGSSEDSGYVNYVKRKVLIGGNNDANVDNKDGAYDNQSVDNASKCYKEKDSEKDCFDNASKETNSVKLVNVTVKDSGHRFVNKDNLISCNNENTSVRSVYLKSKKVPINILELFSDEYETNSNVEKYSDSDTEGSNKFATSKYNYSDVGVNNNPDNEKTFEVKQDNVNNLVSNTASVDELHSNDSIELNEIIDKARLDRILNYSPNIIDSENSMDYNEDVDTTSGSSSDINSSEADYNIRDSIKYSNSGTTVSGQSDELNSLDSGAKTVEYVSVGSKATVPTPDEKLNKNNTKQLKTSCVIT